MTPIEKLVKESKYGHLMRMHKRYSLNQMTKEVITSENNQATLEISGKKISIICFFGSYGWENRNYELYVLDGEEDPKGNLTAEEVDLFLQDLEKEG